ncbi:trypsin-like serine peptidase, partial [Pseudofulvimonas gallinarii]
MASFRIAAPLVIAAFSANHALAQSVSINESLADPQLSTLLAAPDFAKLSMEDSKSAGGPWRYGVQIPVDGVHIDGSSKRGLDWQRLSDGRLSWTWRLTAPGAKTLDLHFADLRLPARAELVLRGEGDDNVRRIAAESLAKDGGEFWSPYVAGEVVDVQIIVPAESTGDVRMQLASVTHGYRGLFEHVDPVQKSGSCNVDVACPAGAGWQDQIDSVGHYTFSKSGSSYVCTGTLVGNTAQTTTPYFLTANHCVSTQAVASTIVVYWNYQSATCRTPGSSASGTPLSRSIASHSQSGTTLVANYSNSDFALLRLNANVPTGANPFFSGWDASGTTPTSAVGIHHPAGHEKRIAVENNALAITGYGGGSGSTHWRVIDWDQGTTEGGSSGSGLWNQNKLLVGQLHGGSAACGNDLSDYYGRLSVSWNGGGSSTSRLRDWLAPSSSATTLAGYRTGGGGTPGPGPGVLANGVPVTGLSGAAGAELRYTLT